MLRAFGLVAVVVFVGSLLCVCLSTPLTVHLIPHSHCDVGYRTTASAYAVLVDQILRSVTSDLMENPLHKFNWVEIYYLQHWWQTTTDEFRSDFASLVKQGRIELILSGYVMQDEAITYYAADIDQMTVGHQWVLQTFGVTPKYGWQIDPFGASLFTPTLWSKAGFKAMVLNRMNYYTKDALKANQTLEFWWTPDASRPQETVFAHVLDSHYIPPDGFDWEFNLPFENPPITDANVANRSAVFASIMYQRAAWFRSSNLLVPFGSDFRFVDAGWQFFNMDHIIEYINSHPEFNMTLQYSTLNDYFSVVMAEPATVSFPKRIGGDFQPYVESPKGKYWGGFYRSYPNLKIASRYADSVARAADVLYSGAHVLHNTTGLVASMVYAREQNAILQHHDAMPGTCMAYVVLDYLSLLSEGRASSAKAASASLQALLGTTATFSVADPENVISQTTYFSLVNPLSVARDEMMKFVVSSPNVRVYMADATSAELSSDVMPSYTAKGQYAVWFSVSLAASSVTSIRLQFDSSAVRSPVACSKPDTNSDYSISNGQLTIHFNGTSQSMSSIVSTHPNNAFAVRMTSKFGIYENTTDDDVYGFRPMHMAVTAHSWVGSEVCTGSMVSEVRQTNAYSGILHTIRTFSKVDQDSFDVAYTVGPIPVWTNVIYRLDSADILNQDGTFVTDDNGFYTMQRNPANGEEPVKSIGGMFLPASAYFRLEGTAASKEQVSVFVGAPTGVASMRPGWLEFLIHRRMNIPSRGDDTTIVNDHAKILVSSGPYRESREKWIQQRTAFPVISFASDSALAHNGLSILQGAASFPNVNVLSLQVGEETSSSPSVWIRLENLDEVNSVDVDFEALFGAVKFLAIQEMSITFTHPLSPASSSFKTILARRDIRSFALYLA
eukprot:ANDGO_08105.mRNA.1 Alpha-mannosidase B